MNYILVKSIPNVNWNVGEVKAADAYGFLAVDNGNDQYFSEFTIEPHSLQILVDAGYLSIA